MVPGLCSLEQEMWGHEGLNSHHSTASPLADSGGWERLVIWLCPDIPSLKNASPGKRFETRAVDYGWGDIPRMESPVAHPGGAERKGRLEEDEL